MLIPCGDIRPILGLISTGMFSGLSSDELCFACGFTLACGTAEGPDQPLPTKPRTSSPFMPSVISNRSPLLVERNNVTGLSSSF